MGFTHTSLKSPHSVSVFCTGQVHMTNDSRSADEEEGSITHQASAKRMRHMGMTDPHDQTQDAALHAVHAEPAGSATQISHPAARCVFSQEKQ